MSRQAILQRERAHRRCKTFLKGAAIENELPMISDEAPDFGGVRNSVTNAPGSDGSVSGVWHRITRLSLRPHKNTDASFTLNGRPITALVVADLTPD
jgi:hypothetical protein